MSQAAQHASPRSHAGRWWSVAFVLAVLSATFLMLGLQHDPSPATAPAPAATSEAPVPTPTPRPKATPAPTPAPTLAASRSNRLAENQPVSLTIPAINVATNVVGLGLNEDGTVEVPDNGDDAGWFNQGPTPGENGSSVILGHVDSDEGPAVFYRLKELRPGNPVQFRRSDGSTVHFSVTRVVTYANEDFPATKVYAGTPGRPTLSLVTCGGVYDSDRGGYQSNVVAYTDYVRTTP